MRKWLYVLILFPLVIGYLKVLRPTNDRVPSSLLPKSFEGCSSVVSSFRYKYGFNLSRYETYLEEFTVHGTDKARTDFRNVEEYTAWIDSIISTDEISLGRYLVRNEKNSLLRKWIINRSAPDKLGHFLFDGLLEEMIFKSVNIGKVDVKKKFIFKTMYAEKLAKEAMDKLYEQPNGRFSRFMNNKFAKYMGNIISWSPLIFGMPPMSLPKFIIGSEGKLLKARNLAEFKNIYKGLSENDSALLVDKKIYDTFRRYYLFGIASFYSIYTAHDVFAVTDRRDLIVELNESVDEAMLEMIYLRESVIPTCRSMDTCLEEYRDEWEGLGPKALLQTKLDCQIVYEIPEDC